MFQSFTVFKVVQAFVYNVAIDVEVVGYSLAVNVGLIVQMERPTA